MKIYIRYCLFRLMIGLCYLLPGRFLYWVALRIADLNFFWLDKSGRKAVLANLTQALPDVPEERRLIEARWIFRNFGKYLTEFFRFRQFGPEFFRSRLAYHGWEHIERTLAEGKGCITLSAHFANWELGVAGLSMSGIGKVTVVAAMHRYGKINELFMRERESMGLNVVDMEKDAAMHLMRALKKNGIVGMMGDRDPTEHGLEVEFFGKPCRFPQGPARIALATGAPVLPAFCLRRTNDCFNIVFLPPLKVPDSGTKMERARAMTQEFAHELEKQIRLHPEQWAAFYPIWDGSWRPD